jgi:transposase
MIQQLTALRGIGVQSATVLVREAFVRGFANDKALGSYAGLASSPYSSGGIDREQGIGKAGNRRVRTVMVELFCREPCRNESSALDHGLSTSALDRDTIM